MTAAAILDLRIFKFLMVGTVKTIELCHCARCRRNRSNLGRDIAIFQDGGSRHIGFLKFLIFNGRASFRGDQSNRFRDIAIFEFFKMVAAAILDFTNFNFLTVGTVKIVELHQFAKFRRNRSNCGQYNMAIFRFLKLEAVASWDF